MKRKLKPVTITKLDLLSSFINRIVSFPVKYPNSMKLITVI